MHLLLLQWNPMAGVDVHDEVTFLPPPVPPEMPCVPHIVGSVLQGLTLGASGITSDATKADGQKIIQRDSDILGIIPHVPLVPPYWVLAPLWSLIAGSKSYFGPASTLAERRPVAVADGESINNQMNCNEYLCLPTGLAVTASTVMCELTAADIEAGLAAAAIDMLITFAFGKVHEGKDPILGRVPALLLQQLAGSPIGYTIGSDTNLNPDAKKYSPGNWGQDAMDAISDPSHGTELFP